MGEGWSDSAPICPVVRGIAGWGTAGVFEHGTLVANSTRIVIDPGVVVAVEYAIIGPTAFRYEGISAKIECFMMEL